MKNARAMSDAGAATILPEKILNAENLERAISQILGIWSNILLVSNFVHK